MHDTVKEVLTLVIPKVLRREWDMVSHLSIQIKTHRNLRRQNEALDQLRVMLSETPELKQKAALVSFVSRSLEYLAGSEAHVKEVATVLVDYAVVRAMAGDASGWADVSRCAHGSLERREFTRQVIVKRLASEFRRDEFDRSRVIQAAVSEFDTPFSNHKPEQLSADLSVGIRDELKAFIVDRVQADPLCAIIAWQWYGMFDATLLARHGLQAYFNARWPDYVRIDGLSLIAIATSARFRVDLPDHAHKRADGFIALIGAFGFSSAPFNKAAFQLTDKGEGLSLAMWEGLLLEEKHSPEVAVGLLFVMMLCTELENKIRDTDIHRRKGAGAKVLERTKIIEKMVARKDLRELRIFSSIASVVEAGTMFK